MIRKKIIILTCILVSFWIGFQIDFSSESEVPLIVSTRTEGNSSAYRLEIGVEVKDARLLKKKDELFHQILKSIVDNTLDGIDLAYDEVGHPRELIVRMYRNDIDKEYQMIRERTFTPEETKRIYKNKKPM
mgnify:FL=1